MVRSGFLPAVNRRALVVLLFASALGVSTGAAHAQDPAAAQPQQQPAQDVFKFSHDGPLLMVWTIKPERAADFEKAWLSIKDALAKSANAEYKALGDGLTVYRVTQQLKPGDPEVFVFQVNPPSRSLTYNPVTILFTYLKPPDPPADAPPGTTPPPPPPGTFTYDEAMVIFKLLEGSNTGIAFWPMQKKG
jgi:hypothetical protein